MTSHKSNLNAAAVSEFLASRRTTRDFIKDKPVPQEILNQILTDALTAPSWSNTRPFKIAIATGETKDRISKEFLRRWDSLAKGRNGNWLAKLKLFTSRYGLPTSNRASAKPYVAELKPRAHRVGAELYAVLGEIARNATRNGRRTTNFLALQPNYLSSSTRVWISGPPPTPGLC